ncbi:hypothetical protein GF362_06405 [Candidatus Dojkabacteria bacterium]|nr:hypothetical protein [Candidatus Dojkabacteria bacterium]
MKKIKNYNQAIDYIYSLVPPKNHDLEPGIHLDRITKFLDIIGNPQNSYPSIHIGGTAGKGSTAYLTTKILSQLGYKVGLHMSPNLVTLNEKFKVAYPPQKEGDTSKILECSNNDLIDIVNWFRSKESIYPLMEKPLSFYESIIAMVFKYFEKEKVDLAVIEVAMGGRLDATNVINSEVAVLNSVGLDHMKFLGNTKKEICWDKMHIMKPKKVFITGLEDKKLNKMIRKHAQKLGSKLEHINKEFQYKIFESNINGSVFTFRNKDLNISKIRLNLIGDYQIHNAVLAIQAVHSFLKKQKKKIKQEKLINAIKIALASAKLKGRFDILQKKPYIIMDGAHNKLKMNSLCRNLKKNFGEVGVELLFSSKNKVNLMKMVKELRVLNIKKIYLSEFQRKYYATIKSDTNTIMKKEFLKYFSNDLKIFTFSDPYEAFINFKKNINKNRVGIVTGSLYLLGKIYEHLDK